MGLCASKSDHQITSEKPKITTRTATNKGTASKNHNNEKANTNPKSKGVKLSDGPTSESNELTPKEAARLAAEKRMKTQNDTLTQGTLGKKLAKERAKTYNSFKHEE